MSFDKTPVPVARFASFVEETNYRTRAEEFGNVAVFNYESKSWELVENAFWRKPFGKTQGEAAMDHPVAQVSYYDASAYCQHYAKRLPSEWEWDAVALCKQQRGSTAVPLGRW